MKIITYYLPQFHEIEENNQWWGTGYTEWTSLKRAKKLYRCHNQPRIPLNENYYNLTDVRTLEWQCRLARTYGIYGWCIYHYWFEGKLLLQKPLELMLKNPHININYCISWANEDWTNGWISNNPDVLQKQTYGSKEDWKNHFFYLLPFFQDKRYIKKDGKPLLVIYHPEKIENLSEMLTYWNQLALKHIQTDLCIVSQHPNALDDITCINSQYINYQIEYQPDTASKHVAPWYYYSFQKIYNFLDGIFKTNYFSEVKFLRPLIKKDYVKTWEYIIHMEPENAKRIPGAFVDWDNTPRKGRRGSVYIGVTPEIFQKYLIKQIIHARTSYKQEYLFLFAWNEWSEGGYLEPDTKEEFGYLNAVKQALKKTNEWEYN